LLMRWMRTIYLPTLYWADKEFFLTFLYIASLGQTWQNPSDTNHRIGLRALISPTRSDINPRVGFKLLSETQFYGQAIYGIKIYIVLKRDNDLFELMRKLKSYVSSKHLWHRHSQLLWCRITWNICKYCSS
jgi:hypothetical protein